MKVKSLLRLINQNVCVALVYCEDELKDYISCYNSKELINELLKKYRSYRVVNFSIYEDDSVEFKYRVYNLILRISVD